jgi:uncharacterized protein RhaS with RHS repeats
MGNRTLTEGKAGSSAYGTNGLNQYAGISLAGSGAGTGTIAYAYDRNGNLVSDGKFRYSYDALNRLVAVSEYAVTGGEAGTGSGAIETGS